MSLLIFVAAAQLAVPSAPAPSQVPANAPVAAAEPVAAPAIIAGNTVLELEFAEIASSKTSRPGQLISLRTVADVRGSNEAVLIPSGAKVVAEVINANPARMMGKAGELDLAARYVEVGGQQIPIKRFRFGHSGGKDNSNTAMIVTALIGLPGFLISGGNIDVGVGARAHAAVARDTVLGPVASVK